MRASGPQRRRAARDSEVSGPSPEERRSAARDSAVSRASPGLMVKPTVQVIYQIFPGYYGPALAALRRPGACPRTLC